MSYYEDEPRSRFGLYVTLGVSVLCLFGYFAFSSLIKSTPSSSTPKAPVTDVPTTPEAKIPLNLPEEDIPESTPEQTLIDSGIPLEDLDPTNLLKQIGNSLDQGDFDTALALIGKDNISPEHLARLQALHAQNRLRLDPQNPIIEIGELDRNRRARFALKLQDGEDSIYFDLTRRPSSGKWAVEKVKLPSPPAQSSPAPAQAILADSLGIAHAFLQAALAQKFDEAKSFVDTTQVSDAKIAGLCILFEEAKYQLRPKKPLRAMFNRDLVAGFMAYVQTSGGQSATEFGLNIQRKATTDPWRVTEINLDSLLADYATRIAGGDVHFTPLVKNPTGGDTLILYFGFDEDGLTPRTTRQLDIVASLLRTDPSKKLTLSGHTDSLGTDNYNDQLSGRRAGAVEKYLLSVGVPPTQILKIAEGETKPRLPNTTQEGQDNPTGRRANRRTEIYLDF